MTAVLVARTALDAARWRERRRAHEERVDGWLVSHLARRCRGERHPVEVFLFTYYSHRPAQLRRWHPDAMVVLRDADPADLGRDYRADAAGVTLDTEGVRARRAEPLAWIRRLLPATAGRPARLGCVGTHEWAMVYRQTQREVRHDPRPLRLTPERTAEVVEERGRTGESGNFRRWGESKRYEADKRCRDQ
ncbi:hypothetical protein JD76_03714 [Micromonospora endolithica]|nr:hypothetical protein JD76_03714 [Micromonospora endolithica]